jgi:hypothetical protein
MQRSDQLDEMLQNIVESRHAVVVPYQLVNAPTLDICNDSLQRLYRRFHSLKIVSQAGVELIRLHSVDKIKRIDRSRAGAAHLPLKSIGYLSGRHRIMTLTKNGDGGRHSRMKWYVFPMLFVEINGNYLFLHSDIQVILAYYLELAESGEDDVPVEELGPVVDLTSWKHIQPLIDARIASPPNVYRSAFRQRPGNAQFSN